MTKNKKSSKETKPLSLPDIESEEKETHDLFISPERREKAEAEDTDIEAEFAAESTFFKTNQDDGHTHNPHLAAEQGLTYTPPDDPATLPSKDNPQGARVAAGFAPSMEASNPDVERLPTAVDNNDLDLRDDIYTILRNNSETGHLTNVRVQVDGGNVNLYGTVESQDDIPLIFELINELDGVVEVQNNLQVA